jgi:hypothetical protein
MSKLVSVIVFCPCCCSNIDLIEADGTDVEVSCECGQTWTMKLDEERLLANGMH